MHCTGNGASTVLLVSGIPRFSFHFALVQSDLATSARVCTYDKGGEAWTDPLPSFTADAMLSELDSVVGNVARSQDHGRNPVRVIEERDAMEEHPPASPRQISQIAFK